MLLYDILDMENIVESSPSSARTTTITTTTRRLRSLHLPSSSSSSSSNTTNEISRRFNSLRRTNTTAQLQSPLGHTNSSIQPAAQSTSVTPATTTDNNATTIQHPQKVHIKLIPNVGMTNRCFVFDVVDRKLESGGSALKLGRYSDRTIVSDRLSFKSKVVSRYHAEIWLSEEDGKIYIKDSGSSSGTFVNHIRLTAANTESSRPHQVVDGDLIQLGVDYKGGLEPMYRAVRMRLEVNCREWQETSSSNTYSLAAFQQLKNQINNNTTSTIKSKEEIQECCICLYCIAPFQALFIAPCSHIYHYTCLRPLLTQNYPGFSCPLCRTYSNLEASVAVEENEVLQMLGLVSSSNNNDPLSNNHSEEDEEDDLEDDLEDDNSPLISSQHSSGNNHHREKTVTVLDDDNQDSSSTAIMNSSPSSLIRPSLFFQRQISSSDGGLAATLVGSPPRRYDAGGEGVIIGNDGGMAREIQDYNNNNSTATTTTTAIL